MSEFATKQDISIETDYDRVVFTIARTSIPMPYNAAFKVASGMKKCGTIIMHQIKESPENRAGYMAIEREIKVNEVSPLRRSTNPPPVKCQMAIQDERVMVTFNNLKVGFHFTDALKISAWLHAGATQAQNWAGDKGRKIHANGSFINAVGN